MINVHYYYITHLCVVSTVLEYAHWWHTLMCVSKVFRYARRQLTYMSKGLTCACRSSHHLFKIRFLSELCIFRDMSPFGMHRGAAVKKSIGVGRSTSRSPLGLEDLHRNKCVWCCSLKKEERQKGGKSSFLFRTYCAGLESLWSISCLVAYRNCDWILFGIRSKWKTQRLTSGNNNFYMITDDV